MCGEVVAVGEGVTGLPDWAPAPGSSPRPSLPGGAFAEYAVVPAAAVLPAPPALDDAEAAALHIGYQTGWFGLHRRAAAPARRDPARARRGGRGRQRRRPTRQGGRRHRHRRRRRRRRRRTRRAQAGRRRGGRPARGGLRRGGQGGHRRSRRRRRLRPGRRRGVHPVHQVRRLRGPDRGGRLRQRHDPRARAQPRPGEELRDPRTALGPVQHPGPGRGPRLPRPS